MNRARRRPAAEHSILLPASVRFQFHLEQARVRSDIRLREGRAKPVDLLANNLHLGSDFTLQMPYPYEIFENLSLEEMQELHEDVMAYQELDMQEDDHKEFWNCLMTVCEASLIEVERHDAVDRAHLK
jgi:hypothetical protein